MANNLMWLIHKPTGLGILLAKHAGLGWFNPSDSGAAYPDVLFERVDLERGIQCEDWTDYTIGFRSVPQSLNTTAAASHIGKHLYVSATTTVPSGVFVAGNEFLVVNSSGSAVTLTQGAGTTLRLGGTATTGSRTVAAYGVASVLCVGAEEFYVTGNVT